MSATDVAHRAKQDGQLRIDNPACRLPRVSTRKPEPNPVTIAEIDTLLAGGIYLKTYAMVALHYYLALRVPEIAAVNSADMDWNARSYPRCGRVARTRRCPFQRRVAAVPGDAKARILVPEPDGQPALRRGDGHIIGNSVSGVIGEAIKRAGLKHRPVIRGPP